MNLPERERRVLREGRAEHLLRVTRGYGLFLLIVGAWLSSLAGIWFASGLFIWSAGLIYVLYDTALVSYVAIRTFGLRRVADEPLPLGPCVSIGVLVAARNERVILPDCVRALQAQTEPPERIVVIDDGSTDDSLARLRAEFPLVDEAGTRLSHAGSLTVFAKPHSGKARSLNEALRFIDTEVIVTIDADTVLAPDAIAGLRRAFMRNPQLVAGCGVLQPRCARTMSGRVFEWFQTFEYLRAFIAREAWVRTQSMLLVSGAFAGFRREAVIKVGGFDPESRVEDYELIHRLHRCSHEQNLGWQVEVFSEAYAETDAPATLRAFLRQRSRWFGGFLETHSANRDMIGNGRYGSVGRIMLPVKSLDTMQPVFGVTAFGLLVYFIAVQPPFLWRILLTIGIKLVLDIGFHLWSVFLYHRWIGKRAGPRIWALAIAASLAEPFSFQFLRHCGAVLGWLSFLRRRNDWVPQLQVEAGPPGP